MPTCTFTGHAFRVTYKSADHALCLFQQRSGLPEARTKTEIIALAQGDLTRKEVRHRLYTKITNAKKRCTTLAADFSTMTAVHQKKHTPKKVYNARDRFFSRDGCTPKMASIEKGVQTVRSLFPTVND